MTPTEIESRADELIALVEAQCRREVARGRSEGLTDGQIRKLLRAQWRETICRCDRCHARIDREGSILVPRAGVLSRPFDRELDICEECAQSFMSWMRPERDGQPQPPIGRCI
jgi:hypothetical protein